MFAGLLPVFTAAQVDCGEGGEDVNEDVDKLPLLADKILSTKDRYGIDMKLYILHKAIKTILSPQAIGWKKGF